MVRFRGKANVRPVLSSEKLESDFKAKLISPSTKEVKTPLRNSKASPLSIVRRSTRTSNPSASRRSTKTLSQAVKTTPSSSVRRPAKTPSENTPSLKQSKVDNSDVSFASQKSTNRPVSQKPKLAAQELDDYSICGFDSELIDDSLWDRVSILNDSLPSLDAVGESAFFCKEKVVRVKKEIAEVFPADDPFGFFQVEREVEEEAVSKRPKKTLAKRDAKVKNAGPVSASKDETPGKRRSSRQILKPISYAQNKGPKRLPTINEKADVSGAKGKVGLRGAIPKKFGDSRSVNVRKKPTKKSGVDNEKILKDEQARLEAQFKVIDKFHLEEENV